MKPIDVYTGPKPSELVSLEAYRFDPDFLPNCKPSFLQDLTKLELIFIGSTLSTRSFGEAKAFIRCVLSTQTNPQQLRSLNDNFLNFAPSTTLHIEDSYHRLQGLASRCPKVANLVDIMSTQLDQYSTLHQLCISFNGGKDCTVLLHALVTLLYYRRRSQPFDLLNLLLIKTTEPFPEQDAFIRRISTYFRCRLITYRSTDLKSALWHVKRDQTGLNGIFMGVRRSDLPEQIRDKLQPVQVTDVDRDWPEFTRISPLLDWTYSDIWNYILELDVPYCALYDRGYTSIGDPHNTIPNPSLLKRIKIPEFPGIEEYYLPAYLLDQENTERNSRV